MAEMEVIAAADLTGGLLLGGRPAPPWAESTQKVTGDSGFPGRQHLFALFPARTAPQKSKTLHALKARDSTLSR
jgi:hypothetical protein